MKISTLALALLVALSFPAAAQRVPAQQFTTEQEAQRHCPDDVVVWLNIPSHIYHLPGTQWFGMTKSGAYVCEREADGEGDRVARNGQ